MSDILCLILQRQSLWTAPGLGDHRAVQKLRLFRWGCECVPSERARGQDIYRIRVEKNHSGKRIGDSGGSKNEQSERDETDI